MITLTDILQTRGLDKCPIPLWKLKLTDTEHEELRQTLAERVHPRFSSENNRFACYARECAVFFAEYWRREYDSGPHSLQMVYDALRAEGFAKNGVGEFYQAARWGAKRLGIELYSNGNGRTQYLDSILYQGGLPMRLVTMEGQGSVWDRFVRGLVWRHINFNELDLGVVATSSQSLRTYCEQLIDAIEYDQPRLMPFACDNEAHPWFRFLKKLAKQEIVRHRQKHPFSIGWEFVVDTRMHTLHVKYVAEGEQELTSNFIQDLHLSNNDFFTIQVRVNGKPTDTFDYLHGYCRYAVKSKHTYHDGDHVAVCLADGNKMLAVGELELSVPHLLFRDRMGNYELGNRLGNKESFLMVPEGWNAPALPAVLQYEDYRWNDQAIKGIHIPATFMGTVRVERDGEHIDFGCSLPLIWTELRGKPLYIPNVDQMLYDVSKCEFVVCCDLDDGSFSVLIPHVEFRNKMQTKWTDTPSFGEITAKAKVGSLFVTPTNKFINIGEGFTFTVVNADENTCQLRVAWSHGRVSVVEGTKKVGGVWQVSRDATTDNKIHLLFVPDECPRNQFTLTADAPFKEFFITTPDGRKITTDTWVPYADLDSCQYHLAGQDIREYTYGTHRRSLHWLHNNLYIMEDGRSVQTIAYEGSLLSLFGSRETLRAILEKTSRDITKAEIPVTFVTGNGHTLSFSIKDNPYRVKQVGREVMVTSKDYQLVGYKGSLRLLKMEDPETELPLRYDEEHGYVLPEEIKAWGKTLLIGQARGRLLPTLVDLTHEMTPEERRCNWESTKADKARNLADASFDEVIWQHIFAWFERIQKDDIPASSILELDGVGRNVEALLCLTFVLYAQSDEEHSRLTEQLKAFSHDLAFSWYWTLPYLDTTLAAFNKRIRGDINNPLLTKIYVKWALKQGDDTMRYIQAMETPASYSAYVFQCIQEECNTFKKWMLALCEVSLLEQYDSHHPQLSCEMARDIVLAQTVRTENKEDTANYVDICQDDINEQASHFFDLYTERGSTGNEQWMLRRVNVVAKHLKKEKINLFEQPDEVRRSIIFCRKACNQQFIIALNNKLAK